MVVSINSDFAKYDNPLRNSVFPFSINSAWFLSPDFLFRILPAPLITRIAKIRNSLGSLILLTTLFSHYWPYLRCPKTSIRYYYYFRLWLFAKYLVRSKIEIKIVFCSTCPVLSWSTSNSEYDVENRLNTFKHRCRTIRKTVKYKTMKETELDFYKTIAIIMRLYRSEACVLSKRVTGKLRNLKWNFWIANGRIHAD